MMSKGVCWDTSEHGMTLIVFLIDWSKKLMVTSANRLIDFGGAALV